MKAEPRPHEPGRLYVIGDIHGRADLLDRMIAAIGRDFAAAPRADSLTVTVGDYIDRGPDAKGVIDRLAQNPFPTEFLGLKGNHEAMLARFLEEPSVAEQWRRFGGVETLHSYGIDVGGVMRGRDYAEAAEALMAALPPAHVAFLASLRTSLFAGRYFVCHAGVRPGVPLPRQQEDDLLWARDGFLDSRADFGKIVVHGHSIAEEPQVRRNRIGIDTGAFASGTLTCLVLHGDEVGFLQT